MALESPTAVLEALRGYSILTPEQLRELEDVYVPMHPNAQELIRTLIRLKWLTVYQAKKILAGRTKDLVVGHYIIQDKLGEGGMGKVFKAVQLNLNRLVALKVMRSALLKNEVALKRFKREVKAAAALSHQNIVRVFDADQSGDRHFLAMEYIEGSDLGRLVKAHSPLPISVACSYIRQAALGLQHAHDLNFVHRDIKPTNILVAVNDKGQYGPKSVVKILDMGLAREQHVDPNANSISTELTRAGTVVGTPDYMSPEQAKNSSNVDHRSDLYSLGCTFFYLLTGEVVFPNGNPLEKLLSHQMDSPRPIQLLRMDTPSEVASIIQCLLAKRPEQRFQSGAALANALEPWCTGKGTTALQPAVVLQAEAVDVDPAAPTIDASPRPGSPFDFGDLNDDDPDDDTMRVTHSDADPTTTVRTTDAAGAWKIRLLLAPLVILMAGLAIGGVLAARKWGNPPAETPAPSDANRTETPRSETPKAKTDPKTTTVTKDLDSLEKYLPNETALLVVLEPKAFHSSPPVRDQLVRPLAERFAKLKEATGVDVTTAVDRLIISYPDFGGKGTFVILQGKTLVTDKLIDIVRSAKDVQVEKVLDNKAELFTVPWLEGDEPLFVAFADASIFLSQQRSKVIDAMEKRDGTKRTKLSDPSIEAAMRVMYSRFLYPHAVFAALGLRSGLIRFVPAAGRLNFATAALHFDDRGMHFYTVADELEAGKAAELQRILAKTLLARLDDDKPPSPKAQKLGELLNKTTMSPLGKGKYYHAHARLPYDSLVDWFAPFLPFELED